MEEVNATTILIAILLRAGVAGVAVADTAPHPAIDFRFVPAERTAKALSAKITLCSDAECTTSEELAVVGTRLREEGWLTARPDVFSPWLKLAVRFEDGLRESPAFRTPPELVGFPAQRARVESVFRVTVRDADLEVVLLDRAAFAREEKLEEERLIANARSEWIRETALGLTMTLAIELVVAALLLALTTRRFRLLAWVFVANAVTVPALYFATYGQLARWLFVGEIAVTIAEAAFLYGVGRPHLKLAHAAVLALACNVASFLAGRYF